jgi:8-oxo-dGTP pyrophosphatase MutT (NUDIX family)
MKTTSCGILVCNPAGELLMCHATGTAYWDIPKGTGEAGESMQQTALRETAEECGLAFDANDLLELGRFHYRPAKDLQLYAALVERVDAQRCHCSTQFRDRFGRERPEMDDFAWVPFGAVATRCAKSMAALLTHALPLGEVLARLRAAGRTAVPRWWNATVRD